MPQTNDAVVTNTLHQFNENQVLAQLGRYSQKISRHLCFMAKGNCTHGDMQRVLNEYYKVACPDAYETLSKFSAYQQRLHIEARIKRGIRIWLKPGEYLRVDVVAVRNKTYELIAELELS